MKYLAILIILLPSAALAQSELATGKATLQEVYTKVSEASRFLSETGAKGLQEFENPRGRFVWKNTYVWATQCEKNYCLPGPKSKDIGLNFSEIKCYKTGKFYILELCDKVIDHPEGAWVEYWWPRPGFDKPQRKVSFMRQVPGTPYQVVSEIYDESTPLADLNKLSSR